MDNGPMLSLNRHLLKGQQQGLQDEDDILFQEALELFSPSVFSDFITADDSYGGLLSDEQVSSPVSISTTASSTSTPSLRFRSLHVPHQLSGVDGFTTSPVQSKR